MPDLRTVPGLQSERLLHVLADYSLVRIVTHDNPDPDAMAAGWGLYTLFQERLDCPIELVGGGAIVRAENRHLVDLLNPPLQIVDQLDDDPKAATVLVDCMLGLEQSSGDSKFAHAGGDHRPPLRRNAAR